MGIILLAMLGYHTEMGVAYWVCYGLYCVIAVGKAAYKVGKEVD